MTTAYTVMPTCSGDAQSIERSARSQRVPSPMSLHWKAAKMFFDVEG